MGTRAGRAAGAANDAAAQVCDTGTGTAEGIIAGDTTADVAVIGGGVIGHGIAFEAIRSGRSVVLIDDAPGSGASWAAAGMLAPVSELHYQEEQLLELMLEASRLWPGFAAALTPVPPARIRRPVPAYLTTPTLAVGADAADRRALADLREVQQACGLAVEPLTVREARTREPLLSPGISCAFDIPADHQVDPRLLITRLAGVLGAEGGSFVRRRAAGLLWQDGQVAGVRLAGGGTVRAAETVVANGLGAAALEDLPAGLALPLRPVYGDILRLRVPPHLQPLLTATVRGMVRGIPVYIVPRQDGTVVIGATQREDGPSDPRRSFRRRHLPAAAGCPAAGACGRRAGAFGSHGAGTARNPGQCPAAGTGRTSGRRRRPGTHHRHRILPARRPADPRGCRRLPATHGRHAGPALGRVPPRPFFPPSPVSVRGHAPRRKQHEHQT